MYVDDLINVQGKDQLPKQGEKIHLDNLYQKALDK